MAKQYKNFDLYLAWYIKLGYEDKHAAEKAYQRCEEG